MKNLITKITSTRLVFILSLLLYKLLLDIVMMRIISVDYAYMGFELDVNIIKFIESYLIILIFSFLLKHKISKPSEFFILFLFLMIVIPLTTIFSLQDKSSEFMYYMLLSFVFIILFSKLKVIKLPRIKNGNRIVFVSTVFIGTLLFVWIISRGGLNYLNFNLFKVYDFRRTVAELVFPGNLAYLMTWFGKVMNPFIIAYYLWMNNKKGTIFAIGIQVLFYAITAHKSMLFYPIMILFVYKAAKKTNFAQLVPLGLGLGNLLSILTYYLSGSLLLVTLLSRRVLLLTAKIHYDYYEFFSEKGFLFYSNRNWFPKIIEYPYNQPIQLVVNGGEGGWANTGFLANGYIHFGLIGMLVYAIIVGIIFSYIDYVSNNFLPMWLCIAVTIVPIFSLTSGDLPTVLINHGLILSILILWLMSGSLSRTTSREKY